MRKLVKPRSITTGNCRKRHSMKDAETPPVFKDVPLLTTFSAFASCACSEKPHLPFTAGHSLQTQLRRKIKTHPNAGPTGSTPTYNTLSATAASSFWGAAGESCRQKLVSVGRSPCGSVPRSSLWDSRHHRRHLTLLQHAPLDRQPGKLQNHWENAP